MTSIIQIPSRAAALDALHAHTAVYTAAPVVESLLDRIGWPTSRHRLLDPGAGDGAFVRAAIRRLMPAPDDIETVLRVRGLEIHPSAVAEAREGVEFLLVEDFGWHPENAAEVARRVVLERDYLIDGCEGFEPDVIAGNPPYMRFARLPDAFKGIYGDLVPKLARGDLQHAFLDRCRHDLVAGGVIALVTADRWLFNDTAASLRESLGTTLGVVHLERLDVESCFYRPKDRRRGTPPRVHPVEIVLAHTGNDTRALGAAPLSPDAIHHDAEGDTLLGDIATVRLAPYVGPAGGFLLSATEAARFPSEFLVPAIDLDDVDFDNGVVGPPRRFVLRLDPKVEPEGAVRDHLLSRLDRMPKKVRTGKWWRPPENPDVALDRPSLLIPRIARSLRVAIVDAGILPVNHNLSIVTDEKGTGLEQIRDRLLSQPVQEWVAANAPRLEDGFRDIRTGLIRRIPVEGLLD